MVLTKDEHAVSLTSLEKYGTYFNTKYTVKFKNTYETLYGESGHTEKTYGVIRFNNFFSIYGIMLEKKKSSKEKVIKTTKTFKNVLNMGIENAKYELKNYWNKKKDSY